MTRLFFYVAGLSLVVYGAFMAQAVSAKVPTPQIFQVVTSDDNPQRPWVTGWTPNGVEVEIFMDGEPQGFAKVVPANSGTASFGWSPQENLPVGWHEFSVRGKYINEYSVSGAVLGYRVQHPTPAPTIDHPEQQSDYVLIKGLVRNNLSVKIYIDGIARADFLVPNHPSGTTNYWYRAKDLLNGVHEVYTVAYDQTGKISRKSRVITFKTEMQKITKGETDTETEMSDDRGTSVESADKSSVVDQKQEGSVTIIDTSEPGEVSVSDEPEDGTISVDAQSESNVMTGEVSSTSEEAIAASLDDTTSTDADQERRNRILGLVILGVIAVILFVWYSIEKKKYEMEQISDKTSDKT